MFPLRFYNYFEIAAFLTSVIFLFKLKQTNLRWLTPFLLGVIIVEYIGIYYADVLHKSNAWLFNVTIPLEYLFYAFLFSKHYDNIRFKKVGELFIIFFPLFALINCVFIQKSEIFKTNFLKVGSFWMIVFSCLYCMDILKQERIINPLKLPFFWITAGLLLFNVGDFVYSTFFELMLRDWKYGLQLFVQINNSLINVLYSCIIVGIISVLWKKE